MGKIKFDHAVIYGGVLYPADTPIEEKKVADEKKATDAPKKATKKAGVKDNDDSGTV